MSVPPLRPGSPVRRMPHVLREALAGGDTVRLAIGEVVDLVEDRYVVVLIGDAAEDADSATTLTVPHLATYTPVIGEPAYILLGTYWSLALGTVN